MILTQGEGSDPAIVLEEAIANFSGVPKGFYK
jgi:hypothetical protein